MRDFVDYPVNGYASYYYKAGSRARGKTRSRAGGLFLRMPVLLSASLGDRKNYSVYKFVPRYIWFVARYIPLWHATTRCGALF